MSAMIELDDTQEIYWVRIDPDGCMSAALLERAFAAGDGKELKDELEDMRRVPGTVKRVLASRMTIGESSKIVAMPKAT